MANRKNIYSEGTNVLTARIKEIRLAAGITQAEMAKRLGKVSHTAVLKLEQGQVRIEYLELRRICRICNVPFRDFVNGLETALNEFDELEEERDDVPHAPSLSVDDTITPLPPPKT